MGYDIMAHFIDIDQNEIEQFITENAIDRTVWKDCQRVREYYKSKHLAETPNLDISYFWNRNLHIHEIYSSQGTNFIRDDARFTNKTYQRILENKYEKPFPRILENINWSLHDAKDALEIAEGLDTFFPEDHELMGFSEWLKATAKYGCVYELSY